MVGKIWKSYTYPCKQNIKRSIPLNSIQLVYNIQLCVCACVCTCEHVCVNTRQVK